MATQPQHNPHHAVDDSIHWKPATSKKGVGYEVGVSKAALAKESEAAATSNNEDCNVEVPDQDDQHGSMKPLGSQTLVAVAGQGNAGIKDKEVDWTVTGDVWKDVDANETAYISRYCLDINHWSPVWDWKLSITVQRTGNYRFIDETKDHYDLTVYEEGDHYVRYNSDQPTIKTVKYRAFDSGVSF